MALFLQTGRTPSDPRRPPPAPAPLNPGATALAAQQMTAGSHLASLHLVESKGGKKKGLWPTC